MEYIVQKVKCVKGAGRKTLCLSGSIIAVMSEYIFAEMELSTRSMSEMKCME